MTIGTTLMTLTIRTRVIGAETARKMGNGALAAAEVAAAGGERLGREVAVDAVGLHATTYSEQLNTAAQS